MGLIRVCLPALLGLLAGPVLGLLIAALVDRGSPWWGPALLAGSGVMWGAATWGPRWPWSLRAWLTLIGVVGYTSDDARLAWAGGVLCLFVGWGATRSRWEPR